MTNNVWKEVPSNINIFY